MPNKCNRATEEFQTRSRMNINMATKTVPNEIPNNSNTITELGHRMRLNMATECTKSPTKWHYERQSRKLPKDNHENLTETDINAERLPMDIERITGSTLPYQATDRDAYRMAYRRIKNPSPNGIPN